MSISIKQTPLYEAHCNECGKKFEDEQLDYVAVYFDEDQLLDALGGYDWAVSGDLCWCEDHDPELEENSEVTG